ncbi:hypothetical protein ACFLRW_05680 [Acidobacteriota bacterium]
MNKTKPISSKEAGRLLWSAAKNGIDHLFETVLPKVAEALNLTFADYDQNTIRMESLFVCLWAASKALEGEKSDLIEAIHEAGLSDFEKKKRNEKEELFYQRNDQYNDAWDEKSGGNQSLLCINILGKMFVGRKNQRELVNFWAFIQITNFVRSLMNALVALRNEIKIEE